MQPEQQDSSTEATAWDNGECGKWSEPPLMLFLEVHPCPFPDHEASPQVAESKEP